MITADDQRATLLALYPLFKEEVYRRREEMMRWTAIGAGSMVSILLVSFWSLNQAGSRSAGAPSWPDLLCCWPPPLPRSFSSSNSGTDRPNKP